MPVGDLEKIPVGGFLGADQIDLEAKQTLQVFLQPKESVSEIGYVRRVEFVEEIDIAFGRIKISGGRRAKKVETFHPVLRTQLGDLRSRLIDSGKHLI